MKMCWKIIRLSLSLMVFSQTVIAEPIDKIAAIVNDNVITSQELKAQLVIQKTRLTQQKVTLPTDTVLKDEVLKHMINTEVQLQLAKANDIEISFEEVSNAIINIAKNNKISLAKLKQSIAESGDTWRNYRKSIKKEILLSTLQQKSIGQVLVTDEQINDYLKANNQKANLNYHVKDILLSLPEAPSSSELVLVTKQANEVILRLKDTLAFESADIALASGNIQLRSSDLGLRSLAGFPSMFSDKIVSMKKGDIVGPIRAANGLHIIKLLDIKGEAPIQMITVSHVKHILLKSSAHKSSIEQKQKLESLLTQIKKGGSFESLAKKYSDDLSSGKIGGDLGWLSPGETVPEFEKSFIKLKPGQISAPVKSTFGWHLIKLIGHKQVDNSKNFKKQQIKQALYQKKHNEALENWLQHLRSTAYIKVVIQ